MYPKISIITPSFNQGKFIEKTIKSVINQNYQNYEHIIVDGGSTDETLDILKKYKDKITYISENDNGQVDAINKGIKMASGEIISFINSDDYYLPNVFKSIYEKFKNPDVFWLTGDSIIVDEDDKEIHRLIRFYKKSIRNINSICVLYFTNFICQPSTFWRKNFYNSIGFFDEELSYVFDYKQWILMYRKIKPIIINTKMSAFRIHKNSKGNLFYNNQFDEEIKVLERLNVNKVLLSLHKISNKLIKVVYSLIK